MAQSYGVEQNENGLKSSRDQQATKSRLPGWASLTHHSPVLDLSFKQHAIIQLYHVTMASCPHPPSVHSTILVEC